jgi:hypothetical protein
MKNSFLCRHCGPVTEHPSRERELFASGVASAPIGRRSTLRALVGRGVLAGGALTAGGAVLGAGQHVRLVQIDTPEVFAKAKKLGLWRACPRTRYKPYKAIATRGGASAFSLSLMRRPSQHSKSNATRRTMPPVQQTGSLDQRVRHVGDATSLRDAQNTDRYLAGSDHTVAL